MLGIWDHNVSNFEAPTVQTFDLCVQSTLGSELRPHLDEDCVPSDARHAAARGNLWAA